MKTAFPSILPAYLLLLDPVALAPHVFLWLSSESFDADVNEEFCGKELFQFFSDSDKEPSCYSLPATPPQWRIRKGVLSHQSTGAAKDYASENEAQKDSYTRSKGNMSNNSGSFSGDSDGNSAGQVVITRPKGGQRTLCMDLEEVKVCKDLGIELEHEHMLEMLSSDDNSPSPLGVSLALVVIREM
ncbi:hypothetical protein V6N12_023978 [Hibiscus sabdariffa]|uniref:Uncharacterized protein n=1 Tax=Hibiscus sabdariffa TaxID=183260 RepID=A0ABR2FZ90_9ROSI